MAAGSSTARCGRPPDRLRSTQAARLERHDVGSFGRETSEDADVQMLMFGHQALLMDRNCYPRTDPPHVLDRFGQLHPGTADGKQERVHRPSDLGPAIAWVQNGHGVPAAGTYCVIQDTSLE
jgi:hypothetical protein